MTYLLAYLSIMALALALAKVGVTGAYLVLFPMVELVKRVVFVALYPFAYACRKWARAHHGLLWAVLDDTIVADSVNRGAGPLEYCCYGKRAPLGFLTERLPAGWFTEFLRAFSWGALRNNGINFMTLTERWIGQRTGTVSRKTWGEKSFYEVRQFAGGLRLPYVELWPWAGFRVQCGFISCGRFQVQARAYP